MNLLKSVIETNKRQLGKACSISASIPIVRSGVIELGKARADGFLLIRTKAWSEMDLAAILCGSNPGEALVARVGAYWDRENLNMALDVLSGIAVRGKEPGKFDGAAIAHSNIVALFEHRDERVVREDACGQGQVPARRLRNKEPDFTLRTPHHPYLIEADNVPVYMNPQGHEFATYFVDRRAISVKQLGDFASVYYAKHEGARCLFTTHSCYVSVEGCSFNGEVPSAKALRNPENWTFRPQPENLARNWRPTVTHISIEKVNATV